MKAILQRTKNSKYIWDVQKKTKTVDIQHSKALAKEKLVCSIIRCLAIIILILL